MGVLGLFSKDCRCGGCGRKVPGNPDPASFKVVSITQIGNLCLALLLYPDAVTHGGMKISIYETSEKELRERSTLDPHFLEDDLSPIARFPATKYGWEHAFIFCTAIKNYKKNILTEQVEGI